MLPARAGEPDALDRYLGDLQAYSLLDPAEELAVAREIEASELAHLELLLSDPELLARQVELVARHVEVPPRLAALLARSRGAGPIDATAVREAAAELRALEGHATLLTELDATARAALAAREDGAAALAALTRAHKAHAAAKHRLVTANLRLVVALARRYPRGLLPFADLVQEGNLGLLRAVERFDYRRGFRFSTYAAWWIRHAFNRGLSDRGRLVRLPVHAFEDAARIARARHALLGELGREPSAEDLARKADLPLDRVLPFTEQSVGQAPMSLDRKLRSDGDATLLDVLPAEALDLDALIDVAGWEWRVAPLLGELSPMEAAVVRYRYGLEDGEELTLREIGDKYGLSRERIRQLQEQALEKLRRALRRTEPRADSAA